MSPDRADVPASTEQPAPACWPGNDANDFLPCAVRFPSGTVSLAQIGPEQLDRSIAAIRRARRQLEDMPVGRIVEVLDACAASWCDPNNPVRQQAVPYLHATTGCDAGMLSAALTATFEALRARHLEALIQRELGGLEALDDGLRLNGRRLRAFGPALTWIVGGGVVPNSLAVPVFASLLCKSAVLAKTPTREPIFGALLAESIAAIDKQVGACIAAGWWAGGTGALDARAADTCDAAIATGSDTALAALRHRLGAGKRIVEYGDRVSVIGIGREKLAQSFANLMWTQVAEAIGWYDQQGCLSPHVVYIEEGGELSPRQAAERLADAMALYENKAPRGPVSDEVAAALETRRQRADVLAMDSEKAALWSSPQRPAAWTVVYESDPAFTPSPGYRFVTVKPVYDLEDLPTILRKSERRFQAVGLEVDTERRSALAEAFTAIDASRLCPVADLQRPPADWPRDGKPVLGSLVRWIDVG